MVQIRVFSWEELAKVVRREPKGVRFALRGFRSFSDAVGNAYVQFYVNLILSDPCVVVVYETEPVLIKGQEDYEKLREAFIKKTLEIYGDWIDGVVE